MEITNTPHLRFSAYLLVAGWTLFWAGAFTPPWKWWYPSTAKEYLTLIANHKAVWLWIAVAFAIGVILTVLGLVVLSGILQQQGELLWSRLGQSAFALGSIFWLINIGFRATATISAADTIVTAGVVPDWFEPTRDWTNILFAIYMVLAYLSIAAFGRSMVVTGIEPLWIAKTCLIFGIVGAVGFIVRIPVFDPPLMIHLPLGLLGFVMLFRYGWG